MKVAIGLEKSIHENAAHYYDEAKKVRGKAEGVRIAMADVRKKIEEAAGKRRKVVKVARKREWFEEFHWSFTNSGKLILAGKTAQQNDKLVGKMEERDLFFHADIRGAAATILRDGAGASDEEKMEAATISACYSKAWARGMAAVDTYAVKKGQLSKHASGGFVGAGGFAISGMREWFRNTKLMLVIGIEGNGRVSAGSPDANWMKRMVLIVPGKLGKKEAAKKIAEILGVPESEVMPCLPAGKTSIIR